jgi:hypothetical protein
MDCRSMMNENERMLVAIASARMAGVHPDWIAWAATRSGSSVERKVTILEYMETRDSYRTPISGASSLVDLKKIMADYASVYYHDEPKS